MHHHTKHETLNLEKSRHIKIALVGRPNVGKSSLFYALTGRYTTISNYPGTTIDITIGMKEHYLFIDTPGIYSLIPSTQEEVVTREIIEKSDLIIHVVDSKNLSIHLLLTLELIEAGLNVILVLNLTDEAQDRGIEVDANTLSRILGIPVVKTIATEGKGINELLGAIEIILKNKCGREPTKILEFSKRLDEIINDFENHLKNVELNISRRLAAILLILGDPYTFNLLPIKIREEISHKMANSKILRHVLMTEIIHNVNNITSQVVKRVVKRKGFKEKIDVFTLHPIVGILLTLLSLLFIYYMAGVLAAQIIVDEVEGFFEENINSLVNTLLEVYVPNYWLRELFGGEYGVITLAIRYAIAIVLPIVSIFFLSFSILEDSGILPRTAYLLDAILKKIGLSGKAAIPLILGTGCGTMAILTTRILHSKRERLISAVILSIGVPCSAQLGLIIAVAPNINALTIWFSTIVIISLALGLIASRLVPGRAPLLFMEIPPIRIPRIKNVLLKTYSRVKWYVIEIIPIFIAVSIFIWFGRVTGVFDFLIAGLSIPVTAIGLPPEASKIFLYGFFRRDYGAAGLYDLVSQGLLNEIQIITSMVTLTLFVPCVAMFAMMWKEFGIKNAIVILLLAFTISFTIGYFVFMLLGGVL